MWGYDRDEDASLVPLKTQEEHFQLFCMVLERGFAIHTGKTDRLLVEFRLQDVHENRYLPKVIAKSGVSFRIPEQCLIPQDVYLYYDPSKDTEIPELAHFRPDDGQFIPFDYSNNTLLQGTREQPILPVVKLSTLKGLHYIKDIACLQMYHVDYPRLLKADTALAQQLREILLQKMARFVEFSDPWIQANQAERAAQKYLAERPGRFIAKAKKTESSKESLGRNPNPNPSPNSEDSEFLSWD